MKIKAVIIGFSHMHVNEVALYISERADMELLAVADVPSNGAEEIPPLRYTTKWNLLIIMNQAQVLCFLF